MEQQSQEQLEQSLEKTTLGHFFNKYSKLILKVGIGLLVGSFVFTGWYIYQQRQNEKSWENSYDFVQTTLNDYKEKKIDEDTLKKQWEDFVQKNKNSSTVLFTSLEAIKTFQMEGKSSLSLYFLQMVPKPQKGELHFLWSVNLAALYEDAGEWQKSLESLSTLKGKESPLMDKVFLDKGRMYQKLGKIAEAKKEYEQVIASYPSSEFAKVARLFLDDLP
ncbi:MAG: tetratricopeptide repeat protein [Bacteriovoracaceae bacterium]|nr:tetratricopeptide repeat protein [Bacteriovoracaceae bacterium]